MVDSSVPLDVLTDDAPWLEWSQARLTEAAQPASLARNAIVLAEIAPRFSRVEALRDAMPSMCLTEEIPVPGTDLIAL